MTTTLRTAAVDEAVTALHLRCHEEAYGRHLPPKFCARRRVTLPDTVIGAEVAVLWVLEDYTRARAFYARNGFVADGARDVLDDDWCRLPTVRMVRPARHATGPAD